MYIHVLFVVASGEMPNGGGGGGVQFEILKM